MSDKPETLAAILREMLDFCSGWSEDVDVTVKVGLIYGWKCRIEAAAERELDEARKARDEARETAEDALWELAELRERAPGNSAAMRAALEWVAEFVELGVDDEYGTDGQNLALAAEKARAALAAPARNCDRPECRTEEGASATYIDEHPHEVEPDASTYGSWLLAPAEGGAK